MYDPVGISRYPTTFADWSLAEWHPKLFVAENVTTDLITSIKSSKQFVSYRNFWKDFQSNYSYIEDPSLPQPERSPSNGFCSINGLPRNCFLFARKFDESTIEFLLDHCKELLGF
ncbi:hypothetical protein CLOM_g2813 [Closterium sp. NIES-68]|nr:hypothetical protein CLOM_g2813 [Closterium sp. NIES-68]